METIDESGNKVIITEQKACEIHEELISQGYVKKGQLTQKFFDDKKEGNLDFGDVNDIKTFVAKQLSLVFDPDTQKPSNGRTKKEARFIKEKFAKKEWQDLWKRINTRTFYNVNFDTSELVKKSVEEIDKHLNVTEIRIVVESGGMNKIKDKESLEAGEAMKQGTTKTVNVKEAVSSGVKYDLVGELVQRTGLTRRTIVNILKGIREDKFMQFQINPEEFIIKVSRIINDCKAISVIQHIKYEKMNRTFDSDIFEESTLRGVIGKNALESTRSLYDLVVVDSEGIEMDFAKSLENDDMVAVYTKLPSGFYISTPMGKYNPDWAVAFKEGTVKHIYFVAETKGNSLESSQLRGSEAAKIDCAIKHFETISTNDVIYSVVKSYQELYNLVTK